MAKKGDNTTDDDQPLHSRDLRREDEEVRRLARLGKDISGKDLVRKAEFSLRNFFNRSEHEHKRDERGDDHKEERDKKHAGQKSADGHESHPSIEKINEMVTQHEKTAEAGKAVKQVTIEQTDMTLGKGWNAALASVETIRHELTSLVAPEKPVSLTGEAYNQLAPNLAVNDKGGPPSPDKGMT